MFRFAVMSIDPAIGRFDYSSLSDQARMEMLIEGMKKEEKEDYLDENGSFRHVCEWVDVECTDDRVTEVAFLFKYFDETPFPFRYIPPSVTKFEAENDNLRGTLDACVLPGDMRWFSAAYNRLHGPLDLKAFPRTLTNIRIGHNLLSGGLVLAELPPSLEIFDVTGNEFSGELNLNSLPPALEGLWVGTNALTGSINIERLPKAIEIIDLRENSFSGDFRMLVFPKQLKEVNAWDNALSDKVVLGESTGKMHFYLCVDDVSLVVDLKGAKHEWHDDIVEE